MQLKITLKISPLNAVRFIKGRGGRFIILSGLCPQVVGHLVSDLFAQSVPNCIGIERVPDSLKFDPEMTDKEIHKIFCIEMKRIIVSEAISLITFHPFEVVGVRMMCRVIGNENLYRSMFESIKNVYQDNGIRGFYHGFVASFVMNYAISVSSKALTYYAGTKWKWFDRTDPFKTYLFHFSTVVFIIVIIDFYIRIDNSICSSF